MSSITLSSATRQNLLVAQDTASLLSTTQNRLATGKKVNTALDGPSSFFTAQGLDNRAGDLSNILDSISNGVQVIQAANTGITSLQKLVDNAKSVANQALQATIGYSTKSNVSTTIAGATASDLRGSTGYVNAQKSGNVLFSGAAGGNASALAGTTLGGTAGTTPAGTAVTNRNAANATKATLIIGASATDSLSQASPFNEGETFTVNGKTVTFSNTTPPAANTLTGSQSRVGNTVTDGSGNSTVYVNGTTSVGDVLNAIDLASGAQKITGTTANVSTIGATTGAAVADMTSGKITFSSSTGADLSISGRSDALAAFGLTSATGSGVTTITAARTTTNASLATLISDGSTLNVNGKSITFKNAPLPAAGTTHTGVITGSTVETDGDGNSTVYLQGGALSDVLKAIDLATGVQTATLSSSGATVAPSAGNSPSQVSGGTLKLSTGSTSDLSISGTGNALSALGLAGSTGTSPTFTATRGTGTGGIAGKELTFASLNGGRAVRVTFGDGTNGTVKTLDDLNAKLSSNNMVASIDAGGKLTISTTNDYASSTIGSVADGGAIGGTAASIFSTAAAPVEDTNSQNSRKTLLSQFNQILDNIKSTAQDASFNGVNLLNGDTLKLTFNEKGSSTMNLLGVTFDPAGLGLTKLGQNGQNEFEDISSANKVISSLTQASTALRQQASTFGSNLSVVQNRQDFNKQIINVLQTGSSKLTDADLNEEAANSQALSTRQSLTVSALSLANQAQQSVLQLLR